MIVVHIQKIIDGYYVGKQRDFSFSREQREATKYFNTQGWRRLSGTTTYTAVLQYNTISYLNGVILIDM